MDESLLKLSTFSDTNRSVSFGFDQSEKWYHIVWRTERCSTIIRYEQIPTTKISRLHNLVVFGQMRVSEWGVVETRDAFADSWYVKFLHSFGETFLSTMVKEKECLGLPWALDGVLLDTVTVGGALYGLPCGVKDWWCGVEDEEDFRESGERWDFSEGRLGGGCGGWGQGTVALC